MAYTIDHSDQTNYGSITVADQTINQETSLGFVGKNYTGYSKVLAENFLHLLENFAKSTQPNNPVVGQLWYDTNIINNPPQPQLKVWDGTKWVAAGNVTKKTIRPTTAVIGDLWVDTSNQQLYLWSGSNWILVGPQFSEGAQSGPKVESIYDTLNVSHTIISLIVGGDRIIIISRDAFTPKAALDGFSEINQGINISTKDFDLNGVLNNKLWGVADRASKLVVSGFPDGLDANNFLRTDVTNTTNYPINIRNNGGLVVGSDLNSSLSNNTLGNTVLYNKNPGSTIIVRINNGVDDSDIITAKPTTVGINNTNPVETLDVSGTIAASGNLTITSTTDSTLLGTGSLKTSGGASIAKTLRVGTGANITGTLTINNAVPATTNLYDLGTDTTRFKRIYANVVGNLDGSTNFIGEFTGAFNGSVTGTASRLTSPTDFSLIGDITSNTISFNGAQIGGTAIFQTTLSSDVISAKDQVFDSFTSDEFILNRPSVGLRKTTKQTFLSNVGVIPVGGIMPFAGANTPQGFLLCDGAEVLISQYPELYAIIGNLYQGAAPLLGLATFRLPDLRGRFALGADNMNNQIAVPLKPDGLTSGITTIDKDGNPSNVADRVTSITADQVGLGSGIEEQEILTSNLPQHTHTLQGQSGTQFYAPSEDTDGAVNITDDDAVGRTAQLIPGFTRFLTTAGPVDSNQTDVPINVMNPYLTINYVIFTGRFY